MRCVCPVAGYCERHKRRMVGRLYELCSGICPPERPCPPEDVRLAALASLEGKPAPPPRELTAEEKAARDKAAAESAFRDRHGPGTQLHALLESVGLTPKPGCQCEARKRQMNAWGVAGCREHRDEIIGWLKDEAARSAWGEWFRAANQARRESWFRYQDTYGCIVDEAVRRAEET